MRTYGGVRDMGKVMSSMDFKSCLGSRVRDGDGKQEMENRSNEVTQGVVFLCINIGLSS